MAAHPHAETVQYATKRKRFKSYYDRDIGWDMRGLSTNLARLDRETAPEWRKTRKTHKMSEKRQNVGEKLIKRGLDVESGSEMRVT